MKLRRRPVATDRRDTRGPTDDGGGHGAEYVDSPRPRDAKDDTEEDRTAWSRARHWTPDPPQR